MNDLRAMNHRQDIERPTAAPPRRQGPRAVALSALATLACAGAPSVLAAQPELASIDFLPAVQSSTQNGRVQLLNLGHAEGRGSVPPDPCRVAVQFLNAAGDEVGAPQKLTIPVGHSATAAAPVFLAAGIPSRLRAHVVVVSRSAIPPGPCAGLHGGYEVYDTQTMETKFVSPGAIRGFNPQPDPPGSVGAQ